MTEAGGKGVEGGEEERRGEGREGRISLMAYEPPTDQETGGVHVLGTKLGGKRIHYVIQYQVYHCTLLPPSHLTHTRSSFLQLVLKNTCPLPIALTDPMIATELELTHLHEEMPAVSS